MGIIGNIIQYIKQKQDNKIIDKIKHSNSSEEIYNLLEQLQLDDSRMKVFKLFDGNHIFDNFKENKYDKIIYWSIENPYHIFEQLKNDRDKFTMIQYFYEHGINDYGLYVCMGGPREDCNKVLLKEMKTQEYKEKALDLMYSSINFDYDSIDETVLSIIDNMQTEKKEQFLQEHSFNNRMALKAYIRYNNETLIERSNSSIKEYLSGKEIYNAIRGLNKQQATKLLELYGNTMHSDTFVSCIETSFDTAENLENMLNKYHERLDKGIISSILISRTVHHDYKSLQMCIENFSQHIDEEAFVSALKWYNRWLIEAEERIKKFKEEENTIRNFVEHDKENPQFLYNIACKYYDTKIQDENFKPTLVNTVIANLPLMDRFQFVRRYQDTMEISKISGIGKDVISHVEDLDISNFLIENQDLISKQDIVDIINLVPFKQRIELIKVSNLDEEQKNKIILYAQEQGEQNVSFLELATTKANIKKMIENIQTSSEHNTININTNEIHKSNENTIDK